MNAAELQGGDDPLEEVGVLTEVQATDSDEQAAEQPPGQSDSEAAHAETEQPEVEEPQAEEAEEPLGESIFADDEPELESEPEASVPKIGPGEELSDEELDRQLLGILFASPDALSEAKLIELLDRPSRERVGESIERSTRALVDSPLPVLLEQINGGWRLLTDPMLGELLRPTRKDDSPEKLTGATMETLAIVAYRQPVTKAEVEAIRGVQSGTLLRALVDRRLARIVGRADQPGAPLLYGTTKDFLDRFGLASLKALPRDGELVRD